MYFNINNIFFNLIDNKFDNLIDNLKSYINEIKSLEKLSKLPKSSRFTVDRFENNFAVCEEMKTQIIFNIPLYKLQKNINIGDVIVLKDDLYVLDKDITDISYQKASCLLNELYKSK